jgi:hypothetical protein
MRRPGIPAAFNISTNTSNPSATTSAYSSLVLSVRCISGDSSMDTTPMQSYDIAGYGFLKTCT